MDEGQNQAAAESEAPKAVKAKKPKAKQATPWDLVNGVVGVLSSHPDANLIQHQYSRKIPSRLALAHVPPEEQEHWLIEFVVKREKPE